MTTTISKEVEFDAGHRVPLHASKCRNPHGHRYRVRATIAGEVQADGPEQGMLKDFSFLKHLLTTLIHDDWDHAFLCAASDPLAGVLRGVDADWRVVVLPTVPTAENLAQLVFDRLAPDVEATGYVLTEVAVWETPTSVAYVTAT